MLLQRIVTAALLLLVLLPALFYPEPSIFHALTLVFIGAAAWEWARLSGLASTPSLVAGVACAAACAVAWWAGMLLAPLRGLWIAAAVLWTVGGAWLLRSGVHGWQAFARPLRMGLGLVGLWLAWIAIGQARIAGINFLLSALALVWVADVGAYFAGRNFGGRLVRRKLAPSISPGKTWEGALGGVVGVVVLALVWQWADRHWSAGDLSLYSRLLGAHAGWAWLAVLWLTAMSVVGDLVESLVKRAAGAKDSSALLPGHGGVLDRIDALLPTMPLALLLGGL